MLNRRIVIGITILFGMIIAVFSLPAVALESYGNPQWEKIYDSYVFNSMTYHDGLYVGVGFDGNIGISENGIDWEYPRSNTLRSLTDVTYGAAKFVAVGDRVILTSDDGETWHPLELSLPYVFQYIVYNGNIFVALTTEWLIMTSVDGINWEENYLEESGNIVKIREIYTDGKSIFASTENRLFISENGIDWEPIITGQELPIDYGYILYRNLINHKGTFMVWGRDYADNYFVAVSKDGKEWEATDIILPEFFRHFMSDGERIFALGRDNIFISFDGVSWDEYDVNEGEAFNNKEIYYFNGVYFRTTNNNKLFISEDGFDWTEIPNTRNTELGLITAAGSNFNLANNYNKTPEIATNGRIRVKVGKEDISGSSHGDGAFDETMFIGTVSTSTDGKKWETKTLDNAYGLSAVTYGKGQFVAVGSLGSIVTSPDGINWKEQVYPTPPNSGWPNPLNDIIWDKGQFVAAGTRDIVYSPDGISWFREENMATGYSINQLLWDDERYVGVCNEAIITAKRTRNFADIENHWAKNEIISLVEKGVVKGVSSTSFEPERAIKRAEFSALLVRALQLADNGSRVEFSDLPQSNWFYQDIMILCQNGILQGYEDKTIRPAQAISREEAMTMIARAMKLMEADIEEFGRIGEELLQTFADYLLISEWAKEAVAICVGANIVKGSGNKINPAKDITRAETAAIIARLIG